MPRVERHPYDFDFLATLRRLECIFREFPRHGTGARPADEAVRLGQDPSMAFASTAITSFRPPTEGRLAQLFISFFGLFGPHGPLPVHLTEYARDRVRNAGDRTLVAFANIFHHRMMLLFYRAWSVAQATVSADRPEANRFDDYLGSLFGLADGALKNRDALPDRVKLYYAARFSFPTRNAEGLEQMVSDHFDFGVDLEQFIGEWVTLPEDSRFQLGLSRETSTLGRSTVLGGRIFRADHKFRIVLGPLDRDQFQNLLPGGQTLKQLVSMVRQYVGDEFAWDVRLVLRRDASDVLELGKHGRLGWNTRLGLGVGERSPEDLVVDPFTRQTRRLRTRAAA